MNEICFVATDSRLKDASVAAQLAAASLGEDQNEFKKWLNDPQKLLELIAAAQGSRGGGSVGTGTGSGGSGSGGGGEGAAGTGGGGFGGKSDGVGGGGTGIGGDRVSEDRAVGGSGTGIGGGLPGGPYATRSGGRWCRWSSSKRDRELFLAPGREA